MADMFAKLFDTPHGQLLAYLDDDTDSKDFNIVVRGAAVNGVIPSAKLSYDSEESRLSGFDKFSQDGAEHQAAAFNRLVSELGQSA